MSFPRIDRVKSVYIRHLIPQCYEGLTYLSASLGNQRGRFRSSSHLTNRATGVYLGHGTFSQLNGKGMAGFDDVEVVNVGE